MPINMRYAVALLFAAFGAATPASAQYAAFPCTWGPGERQVGQTTEGYVTVPLCRYEAPEQAPDSPRPENSEAEENYVRGYVPGPRPEPPEGWRPLYGAFVEWVVSQDESGENMVYDYAYILNQQTPEMARQKVVEACARTALFPEPHGDCFPQLFDHPYLVVIQYPHHSSYSTNERGMFKAFEVTNAESFTNEFVERQPGRWEYCPNGPDYHQPCALLIGFERNGIWPEDKGRKQRK